MKKYMSAVLTLSILFAGCGAQDDKVKEDNKEEVKQDKKDEKSKSDKAKEKIAKNKKSEKSTEEVEQPATQEAVTTESQTSEPVTTEQTTTQQPTTEQQVQNDQLTDQERIDFCKNIRGGIPEVCMTPVIRQAGDEKVAIERKATEDFQAGRITREEQSQRNAEASEIMRKAWIQEFGVDPFRQ